MLKLNSSDIILSQSAADKFEAITSIAQSLTNKNFVEQGYVEGMLEREKQNSTFLGNGIAIPHGTTQTRSLVKSTGIILHHFPDGIEWDKGNKVYLAIGIAAKSDEHLGILKQLTKVLSADGVEELLRTATTPEALIALLQGEVQLEAEFATSLIQLELPIKEISQLTAIAAGLLKHNGYAENAFVADLVTKAPTHLGKGLWVIGSAKGVNRTAVSFVSAAEDFEYQDEKVRALLAFAACNNCHLPIIDALAKIVFDNQQEQLLQLSAEQVLAKLKGEPLASVIPSQGENVCVFTIKNAHGLHARPGAILVAETKKFNANIHVVNLDGDGKAVNAKSLMKVMTLGVKQGNRLQFSADGDDAPQALEAIGKVIAAGLGES